MFRKYEKTPRIRVPQYSEVKGKFYLSDAEVQDLLGSRIEITEKLDGANTGIIRTKREVRLQKRGSLVDYSEHEQFNRFKAWSAQHMDKLMKIPKQMIVYGELMFCVHSIYYDRLTDWFQAFAAYDQILGEYVPRERFEEVCHEADLAHIPLLYYGYATKEELVPKYMQEGSAFGSEPAEGIVVWNPKRQMRAKVVKPAFLKRLEGADHWVKGPIRFNRCLSRI